MNPFMLADVAPPADRSATHTPHYLRLLADQARQHLTDAADKVSAARHLVVSADLPRGEAADALAEIERGERRLRLELERYESQCSRVPTRPAPDLARELSPADLDADMAAALGGADPDPDMIAESLWRR